MANNKDNPFGAHIEDEGVSMLQAIGNAYTNGDFCDATILCQGHEWRVHKVILAARSDPFRAMFQSDCKVGRTSFLWASFPLS